ncbi:1-(5-phosphoribosyl)-5-((5-phosphoribosylamino)methylideneamino)imidazole-4-carboxamide isomerase [Rosa chinensis]|uniref:1-(5-phosphoribosyl)-5-((5-phosphoribosylamino)methylideneamino)imidazole-4-carboxamide isomerase n=1 Tax=Rosa chinensis TaxID=74649 RepID=A0A2P6QV54_ROSCH|nr:1-(5-phosphoribosyl)-5-((5-phosphoribosylamino)methylideneamino)imidazole-4-carboxamide isomerase [Rosa chinensis]
MGQLWLPISSQFESDKSAGEYAKMYKEDGLTGGHVIMLGADPLSRAAAIEALHAYSEIVVLVYENTLLSSVGSNMAGYNSCIRLKILTCIN